MKNLVVVKRKDLNVLTFGDDSVFAKGTYRVITKCQAGFMVSSEVEAGSPIEAFRRYKAKAIQSIAFMLNGGHPITVYARTGKKVWATEQILSEMTVGDINQDLTNTALYDQAQYKAVNAKTWASKAYMINEDVVA